MKYYRVLDDLHLKGRWHLSAPVNDEGCDDSDFTMGRLTQIHSKPTVDIRVPGIPMDFTLTSFDVPVVSARLLKEIKLLCGTDVQFVPVQVGNRDGYTILNAIRVFRCLDESRSEFTKWTEQDGRPDRLGQYQMVTRLRIDSNRVPPQVHVFRIEGWYVPLIISQAIADAVMSINPVGVVLQSVD